MEDENTIKVGARHSGRDQQALQAAHDALVNVGAMCTADGKAIDPADVLLFHGDTVKALGNGKVAGYLIRFTNENDKDLTGDYFAPDTDYGDAQKSAVLYQHGLDAQLKRRKIGEGKLTKDDVGVWVEAQLNMRDDYEKAIYELAKAGKLGWSSGTAGHLVEREASGKILAWPLGLDASLTPTPAEYRNAVVTLKSLITHDTVDTDKGDQANEETKTHKELDMDTNEIKALFDEQKASIAELVENKANAAAAKAVDDVLSKLPEVKAAMNAQVEVVKDEADQPFETKGAFFMAVKNAALYPGQLDKRLLPLKATGLSEAQPSQAGFLVPQQTAAGIAERMYNTGSLLSLMSNKDSVTGNNMTYNVVDETSRADGSRFGGLQAYWGAEAGTKVASKPKFRQLELKLKKLYVLTVATDELLEDAPALESWLGRTVPNEIKFKVEDSIINGDGVGKPLGILNSPALKSAVRTDANEIDALDIGRMWAARWVGASDYVWLANPIIFPQLLSMSVGNQAVFMPAGGLTAKPYATLFGAPLIETEYNPALGTVGDLMLISPSQYQLIEKGGIQYATSIHVYFTTDESAFRWVYRVDGAPMWNAALTLKDTNTASPFVVLAATT